MKQVTKIVLIAAIITAFVGCQRQVTTVYIAPVPMPVEVINKPSVPDTIVIK